MAGDCEPCGKGFKRLFECGARDVACVHCEKDTFSDGPNRATTCSSCSTMCPKKKQEVVKECTDTQDTMCDCIADHFLRSESELSCEPHRSCPPGQGVVVSGTKRTDTQCGVCSPGTFSPVDSAFDKCRPHNLCTDSGGVKTNGDSSIDNVCLDSHPPTGLTSAQLGAAIATPIAVVALIAFVALCCWWRRRKKGMRHERTRSQPTGNNLRVFDGEDESFTDCNYSPNILPVYASAKALNTDSISLSSLTYPKVNGAHLSRNNNESDASGSGDNLSADIPDLFQSLSHSIKPNDTILNELPGALTFEERKELSSARINSESHELTLKYLLLWRAKNIDLDHERILREVMVRHGIIQQYDPS